MLSLRQEKLINSVIGIFIKTAEPVSSKYLEETGRFSVSSATLRNEMNELEDMGYLTHLHTSGGRVPTDKAYRFYVDNILNQNVLSPEPIFRRKIDLALSVLENDPREINIGIANLLSELSDNVVITNILEKNDFYKVGLSSLFNFPEFKEFDRLVEVANMFDRFEKMFEGMESQLFGEVFEDMTIMIGRENMPRDTLNESVIMARYSLPDDYTGSVTLIGPTRMNYEKNIALVRYIADQLNKKSKAFVKQ